MQIFLKYTCRHIYKIIIHSTHILVTTNLFCMWLIVSQP